MSVLARICLIISCMLASTGSVNAQKFAVKSNLLSDALLNPNIGIEVGLAPKWSLDVTGEFNAWNFSNGKRWKHWLLQPEARYWLCRRFAGHFFGLHVLGGQYNVGKIDWGINFLGTDFRRLKNERFQGWAAGAGIAYGYAWPVHPHWNIETEIGLGWVYTRYDAYPCAECGNRTQTDKPHNYVGPTKLALNVVYIF